MSLLRSRRAELLAAAVTLGIVVSFFLLPRSAEGVNIDIGGCEVVDVDDPCTLTVTIDVPADEFVSSVQFVLEDGDAASIFDGPIPLESGLSDLIPGELTVDVSFGGGIGSPNGISARPHSRYYKRNRLAEVYREPESTFPKAALQSI